MVLLLTKVAKTVGTGGVDIQLVTPYVILAGLTGAIAWDLITWWLGLPTSSSPPVWFSNSGVAPSTSSTPSPSHDPAPRERDSNDDLDLDPNVQWLVTSSSHADDAMREGPSLTWSSSNT
jgi:hypothetical protein